jgi:hypothetical protein
MTTTTVTVQIPVAPVCMFCVQPTTRETSFMNTQIPVNGIYAAAGSLAIAVVAVAVTMTVMGRKNKKK